MQLISECDRLTFLWCASIDLTLWSSWSPALLFLFCNCLHTSPSVVRLNISIELDLCLITFSKLLGTVKHLILLTCVSDLLSVRNPISDVVDADARTNVSFCCEPFVIMVANRLQSIGAIAALRATSITGSLCRTIVELRLSTLSKWS